MFFIGCNFHTRFQQIAMLVPTTGELVIPLSDKHLRELVREWSAPYTQHNSREGRHTPA